jgi:predicted Zn finger-like uncharacterized protein
MILTCPLCQARYLISAGLFAAGPRQVRCARCKHGWQADAPLHIDAVGAPPDADLTPEPDAIRPVPQGSNLPAIRYDSLPGWLQNGLWISAGILGAALLLFVILGRQNIAKQWPSWGAIYNAVGLPIYQPGEGLTIENVHSELRYEDGRMMLKVEGQVRNGTKKMQVFPNIMASAAGSDGNITQSWQIDAPVARLAADETQPFHSSINAPNGTVVEVNLIFVEPKDAHSE